MADIQSIFNKYGALYRGKYGVTINQSKVMRAIESCRTSSLGAHIHTCNECGHEVISYNSCRNRHCPQCQDFKREQWLNKQEQSLLLTHYFHVVFTLPQELRSIALFNQEKIYNLLFKAASQTLLELSKDPKHLGANIGFTTILHTWGQNLMFHPHLHCIIPGGGLAMNNTQFIQMKRKFFIHVKVLGKVFRGKFLYYLKQMYSNNELDFIGDIQYLQNPHKFQELIDFIYSIPWNVNSKPNFKKPSHIMKYLGNYTHRVAISNHRIVEVENDMVTFKWKDYKDGNKKKLMSLDALEFIRRFLLHVLPPRFVKIRHFGLLCNRTRQKSIAICKKLITLLTGRVHPIVELLTSAQLLVKMMGTNIHLCPHCKKGYMLSQHDLALDMIDSS